jgi:hypothetical protein
MTDVEYCSFDMIGVSDRRCRNLAEWIVVAVDGASGYCCEAHLPTVERDYPNATYLPFDPEND